MKTTTLFFWGIRSVILVFAIGLSMNSEATTLGSTLPARQWYTATPSVWLHSFDGDNCYYDKTPPSVTEVYYYQPSCAQVTLLPWSYFIDITDNCTKDKSSFIVTYKDSTDQNCSGNGILIKRTWRVSDRAGNIKVFVQNIYTNRVKIDQVKFPQSSNTYCPAAQNLSVEYTGVPTYNGEALDHYCGLTVDYKDIYSNVCGNSVSIRRHWTVTDCCTLWAINYDQNINYLDTAKPKIVCPSPITYGTNVKECYTHQIMPGIAAADDCNPLTLTTIVIVDGVSSIKPGQKVILGVGNHTFVYHVTDVCGNESICSVPVTVVDGQGPLLVCRPIEVCLVTDSIKVGPEGMVSEYWDDCSGLTKVSLKIRKLEDHCGDPYDDLVFKDSVTICCAGTDKRVFVEIEAKDAKGNASYCVTEVIVTSKLPLKIACQDTVHLTCGTPVPDLIPAITHCGDFKVTNKIIFDNRNEAGVGIVIKRFIVTTSTGLIDSCQTVFSIGVGTDAFGPDDVICPNTVTVQGCTIPDLSGIPGIVLKDTARPCALVTVNLKIDTFTDLISPCRRVKRTWTVKDARQPALNIVCVQNIDIIDTTKPILSGVHDTTLYATVSCNKVVDLPPLIATDCDANVVITNSLNAQGADLGPITFPKGMTFIKYKAVDKCGNKDSLTIKVNIIDTAGFRIACQSDTIVACGAPFTPRAAQIFASCTQIATNILKSDTIRNKCSIIKINFKRIVTDTAGRKDSCTFMVTFRAADTLLCNKISWPHDTILNTCGKSIHPDSLKLKPVFSYIQGACSMVTITFKDSTVASIGVGGCTNTTLRKWSVQDTCSIPPVICTYTQTISVVDNTPPVLKVPRDTMVFLSAIKCDTVRRCDTLLSFLGSATASDCDPNVSIKTVIIGTTDTLGASLVKRYGLGTTSVLVIAKDACGNISKDTLVVTVKDTTKPCAVCKKSNNYMKDNREIRILAKQFNGGSKDNCTLASQLRFSWTKDTNDTILVVDCNRLRILHAGGDIILDTVKVFPFERAFTLYVTDASNNQDTCSSNRFLAFFDSLNLCGKAGIKNTAEISGKVNMSNGKSINNVLLSAIGDEQYQKTTNKDGEYTFDKVNPGIYKMFPYKNDDATLGVSTADLIAIQRHILGLESFTQMNQYIAADVNKDAEVTTIDLLELRKLILGIYTQFPQNTSWRFFDQTLMARTHDHTTVSEFENPYVEAIEKEASRQNFTGIKIGDVNGSATQTLDQLVARSALTISMKIPNYKLSLDHLIEIPISMDITDLNGSQGSVVFDDAEIVGINEVASSGGHELIYNEALFGKGILNFSWIKNVNDKRSGVQPIASLILRPRHKGQIASQVYIDHKRVSAEGYNSKNDVLDINLEFTTVSQEANSLDRMVLWQNAPNPFNHTTSIRYTIPENGRISWTITDLTGRIIESWSRQETKGDHEIKVQKDHLGTTGIYYYKMEYNGYSEVKKFILIE